MNEQPNTNQAPEARKKVNGKVIAAVIGIVVVWLVAIQILAADRYVAVANVVEGDNKIGINPTTERLDFGDLSRESGQSRFVALSNDSTRDKYIRIVKFGELAELMKIENPNFTLKPSEEKRVEVKIYIPVSAQLKNYEGHVWIFKFPKLF